jgi:hypothetical protein
MTTLAQQYSFLEEINNQLLVKQDQLMDKMLALNDKFEYWKQRCEAAEEIILISGTINCEGYDNWQSLKNQQP